MTSQDRDFTTNDDGSVDVHFAPELPNHRHNWVQTVPAKSWGAMFRLYGPLEPWFEGAWRLPDIERLTGLVESGFGEAHRAELEGPPLLGDRDFRPLEHSRGDS